MIHELHLRLIDNDDIIPALQDIQSKINELISFHNNTFNNQSFPDANDLHFVKYKKRLNILLNNLLYSDTKHKNEYTINLPPGHPQEEELQQPEIDFLESKHYNITIKHNKDNSYSAKIKWTLK